MLRISEIFYSIQGEARYSGLPSIFIRLTGCPMRCVYCDSEYAFHGGEKRELSDIIEEIKQYKTKYITVTGGEPLAQKKQCHALLTKLCDLGYIVSIETGNAVSVCGVDDRVHIVLDIKTPSSKAEHQNVYENLDLISAKDQLKFVIMNRQDYQWSKEFVESKQLNQQCEILFSAAAGSLSQTQLAEWILEDQLSVRFQMQLHKQLWGDKPGV
jgi:7-carboxy-7-deazaguanine synthase